MPEHSDDKCNRFTPLYALWTIALLFFLDASEELDMALDLSILIIPVMLLPVAAILIWFLIAAGIHAVGRRWRRVASIVVGSAIAFVGTMTILASGFDATWLRFEATQSRYIRDLDNVATTPRFQVWPWGETRGIVSANVFYTLVFDESDELEHMPVGNRVNNMGSPSVLSGAVAEMEVALWRSIRPLEGHFYLVRETYE